MTVTVGFDPISPVPVELLPENAGRPEPRHWQYQCCFTPPPLTLEQERE